MGGATSKLEENVWEKADGKLRGSEFTVDGADATGKYSIYYLTKRGVNQREFDVTDEESNLIFTTKQVPGTIACFDVSIMPSPAKQFFLTTFFLSNLFYSFLRCRCLAKALTITF